MPRFDVLGVGCVAVDDLMYVGEYPPADAKLRVRRVERHCGGLTATALVAASKLGARCGFGGLLGDDELSIFVEETFLEAGVDVSPAVRRRDARPIHSLIVVAEEQPTRNIFYDIGAPVGASEEGPDPELIRSSVVLFLDHVGIPGGLRALAIAKEFGVPTVADLEEDDHPRFRDLFNQVEHLVIGEGFARRLTGAEGPEEALKGVWNSNREAVVVTCGSRGAWSSERADQGKATHQPAFAVPVADTTGCGDVFHGAYACALARGDSLAERVRFASAAAALKATRPGGQLGAPTAEQVASFLAGDPDTIAV